MFVLIIVYIPKTKLNFPIFKINLLCKIITVFPKVLSKHILDPFYKIKNMKLLENYQPMLQYKNFSFYEALYSEVKTLKIRTSKYFSFLKYFSFCKSEKGLGIATIPLKCHQNSLEKIVTNVLFSCV